MPARDIFAELPSQVEPDAIKGLNHSYRFDITGEGSWFIDVHDGVVTVTEGSSEPADATITTSSEVFEGLVAGTQDPMRAYLGGKIRVSGNLGAALKLQKLF